MECEQFNNKAMSKEENEHRKRVVELLNNCIVGESVSNTADQILLVAESLAKERADKLELSIKLIRHCQEFRVKTEYRDGFLMAIEEVLKLISEGNTFLANRKEGTE